MLQNRGTSYIAPSEPCAEGVGTVGARTSPLLPNPACSMCGVRGIRTHDDVAAIAVFKTAAQRHGIACLRAGSLDLLRGSVRVGESLSEVGGVLHAVPPKPHEERDVTLLEPHVPRLRAYMEAHP